MMSMAEARQAHEGVLFVHPTSSNNGYPMYMAMVVFKNGAVSREDVRDRLCGGDWCKYEEMLASLANAARKRRLLEMEKGKGPKFRASFLFPLPEICPHVPVPGEWRYDAPLQIDVDRPTRERCSTSSLEFVDHLDSNLDLLSSIETHFLSMRLHALQLLGKDLFPSLRPKRVVLTGGASGNVAIAQIIADIFGAPVYRGEEDSASLGAAYRAAHAVASSKARAKKKLGMRLTSFESPNILFNSFLKDRGMGTERDHLVAKPNDDMFRFYESAMAVVAAAEDDLVTRSQTQVL